MPDFIPGLDLCRLFYFEAVRPILDQSFPGLLYSAAIIGRGSEVLGFDDEMSTDHDWGPRAMVFLSEDDYPQSHDAVHEALRSRLPPSFRGYRTDFRAPEEPGPRVEILTIRSFFLDYLNFDINDDIESADWLTFPEQKLRTITAGAAYLDGIGLQAVRDRFAYYPQDVWLYLMAAGWTRIGQEDHLMARAGIARDEIGSVIIGSRLIRDLMRLCFLMEKQYAPYPKWLGTAFRKLRCAQELSPILWQVQRAETWQERAQHFSIACEYAAEMHNALGITSPLPARVTGFHDRPFMVIHGGRFAEAICAQIKDPAMSRLAFRGIFGSIDQMSDSTDILDSAYWRRALRKLYELGAMEYPPDYGHPDP